MTRTIQKQTTRTVRREFFEPRREPSTGRASTPTCSTPPRASRRPRRRGPGRSRASTTPSCTRPSGRSATSRADGSGSFQVPLDATWNDPEPGRRQQGTRGPTLVGDADAPGVQALREPHVRQRRHGPQVRPRPGARRAVALPRRTARRTSGAWPPWPGPTARWSPRRRRPSRPASPTARRPPCSTRPRTSSTRSATGSGPRSRPSRRSAASKGWRRFFGRALTSAPRLHGNFPYAR